MNDTMTTLLNRRSIRAFKPEQITDEEGAAWCEARLQSDFSDRQAFGTIPMMRKEPSAKQAAQLAKLRERTTKLSIDYIVALDEKGKALAELAKLRAEAEWRPIESAPRDGTKVLVALHEFNDPANLYVSCFAAFENGSWIEGGEPIYQPDYFFAIPSPPKDPAHD